MRSISRQNMSTNLDEGEKTQESNEDLLKKLQEKMKESELLKKAVDLGVTDGLGVVPLAKVLPPRTAIGQTTGEGTQEQEEEIEITKDIPTQPPSTDATEDTGTNAPTPLPVYIPAG